MIRIYFINNPTYINRGERFSIGYIAPDGTLTDVTSSCVITILKPTSSVTIIDGNVILINSEEPAVTLQLEIEYNSKIYYTYNSFVQTSLKIQKNNLLNTYKRYLPQQVYASSNTALSNYDDESLVEVLYSLYNTNNVLTYSGDSPTFIALEDIQNRIFPNSGWPAWEQYLVGTNSLYTQENTDYPSLLQLLYETNINNNTNPYFLAWNISRYIYYRLGIQKYVYIGENALNFLNGFILDANKLGHVVFLGNINGSTPISAVIYILEASSFSSEFKRELNTFIRRIMRAATIVTTNYNKTFTELGLVDIGETYHKDPRQQNTYCIQFNENVLAQAKGYSGNIDISYLESFNILLDAIVIPKSPTVYNLTNSTDYIITMEGIWNLSPAPTLNLLGYAEFFSSNNDIIEFHYEGGVQYLSTKSAGTATITVYCYTHFNIYNFTVT